MKHDIRRHSLRCCLIAVLALCATAGELNAATTDLANEPLAQSAGSSVKPNLLFVLDNSGSMAWTYLPDYVSSNKDPLSYTHDYNRLYYDPQFSYTGHRPLNADKTSWRNYDNTAAGTGLPSTGGTGLWTAVPSDAYLTPGTTTNLTTSFKTGVKTYCTSAKTCVPLGGGTWGRFSYTSMAAPAPYTSSTSTASVPPFYYQITPTEYCDSEKLTNCTLSATPTGSYTFPAPVRFCKSTTIAGKTTAVTGPANNPDCQAVQSGTYGSPRFGTFTRVDIVPTTATYTNRPNRTDCANRPTCTYAEEMTNFANWYAYYSTRLSMMKTASGRAFSGIRDNSLRVGFITINPGATANIGDNPVIRSGNTVQSTYYLPIDYFNAANNQRTNWYTKLYSQGTRGGTPLREALSRAGRYYAGKHDYVNSGMTGDPVEYACQQNYTLLTTDGYWNDGDGREMDGTTTMQNYDGQDSGYSTRKVGAYDGYPKSSSTVSTTTTTGTPTVTNLISSRSYNQGCGGTTRPSIGICNGVVTVRLNGNVTLSAGDKIRVSGSSCSSAFSTITNSTDPNDPANFVTVATANVNDRGNLIFTYAQVGSGSGSDSTCIVDKLTQGTTTTSVTVDGTANTLADVAMYYYKTDLRPDGSTNASGTNVSANTVPAVCTDKTFTDCDYPSNYRTAGVTATNKGVAQMHQHMVTYTLGLVDGLMQYRGDYRAALAGDFYSITQGQTNCLFSPTGDTTCDWPKPTSGGQTALDDLWHAAANGRGEFYHASNADALETSLKRMLSSIGAAVGAAAASATSSPNITKSDNFQFSATYRTLNPDNSAIGWDGDVVSNNVDPMSGATIFPANWSAQKTLNAHILTHTTDSRRIYFYDPAATNKVRSFEYANLSATQKGYFDSQCAFGKMAQCTLATLSQAQIDAGNVGTNLVNYLRGQTDNQLTGGELGKTFGTPAAPVYRTRDYVLGDVVSAEPVYVRQPPWHFNDAGYWNQNTSGVTGFKEANFGRKAVVYIAANDGMLHALDGGGCTGSPSNPSCNAGTGEELWAYIPSMVMPNLYKLADSDYTLNHRYFVDGSPKTMDVKDASGNWHTILVGGLNGGGKGYYALDVTNPDPAKTGGGPKVLWEFCSDKDAAGNPLCSNNDPDLGYSYGVPVIMKRKSDGKWVVLVTSGYNNTGTGATGQGILYVLDALTGTVLNKISTGSGTTASPSGLAQISNRGDTSGDTDQTCTYVYGGDLNGDVWRFDFSTSTPTVTRLASLKDAAGKGQPITVRPELGSINGTKLVFVGTGRYLGTSDLADSQQQSLYAFKDSGTDLGNLRTRITSPGKMVVQTLSDTAGVRSLTNNAVNWGNDSGWYFDFNPGNTSVGERVSIKMKLIGGTLSVYTNVPPQSSGGTVDPCSQDSLSSWSYQLDYLTGAARRTVTGEAAITKVLNELGGSGMAVGENTFSLSSGRLVSKVRLSTGKEVLIDMIVPSVSAPGRVSWKELQTD